MNVLKPQTWKRNLRNGTKRQKQYNDCTPIKVYTIVNRNRDIMGCRLFIYYLTQKSLPDSMIYQTIQISGLFNKESNSVRGLFVI